VKNQLVAQKVLCVDGSHTATGIRHRYTLKFRLWLGQAAQECFLQLQQKNVVPKKQLPFVTMTVRHVFKPEVLKVHGTFRRLKEMVRAQGSPNFFNLWWTLLIKHVGFMQTVSLTGQSCLVSWEGTACRL
jgi:hypothetical protein